jgi:hypothetical protein
MRNSATRTTKYILEPVVGTCFDSLAEAYEFYNLYSWEVGFGIRYGHSYINWEKYRSSQDLICQLEVKHVAISKQLLMSIFDVVLFTIWFVSDRMNARFVCCHRGLTRGIKTNHLGADARR